MNDGLPTVYFNDLGRDFTCYFFEADTTPPDRIGKLMVFYRLWKEAWKEDRIPAWSDFKFEDFIGWHTYMSVMDIGGTPEDYKRNLIVGEAFAQCFGRKTLYEAIKSGNPPEKDISIQGYEKYLSLMHKKHICVCEGTATDTKGEIRKFKWIDLPLSDDGEDVSHIITAIQYED
ncbi:hypothetical protein [Pseudemcibacter aquimaris]|uniref:hypothetical protein n=1 Tax=Pseudemcibacter aquimaris TaxID=2857064 RepID=UPI002011287E|nr:hypothetical protein [Pseudemcibacter aquimaris]MCC3860848.1 hypothetical protein [Pseudemcibacter aquimaris]WDU59667.1 hypothetical protein KW060_05265 [Pseudemcibacter aquimaris]